MSGKTPQFVHSLPDKFKFQQKLHLGAREAEHLSPGLGQSSRPLAAAQGPRLSLRHSVTHSAYTHSSLHYTIMYSGPSSLFPCNAQCYMWPHKMPAGSRRERSPEGPKAALSRDRPMQ